MRLKRFAIVMALMLFITACAGEAPQLLDFIGDDVDVIDFGGTVFRIYNDGDEDLRYIDKDSNATSARHEKVIKRLDDVETLYN